MTLRHNLRINQGETFQVDIPVLDDDSNPVPVSGMIARAQIRSTAGNGAVLYDWSLTAANIVLTDSTITLKVPAADSAGWAWRTGAWDLELVNGAGTVTRLIEGWVVVHPEVTRS